MKLGIVLAIVGALVVHLAIILFGGILFMHDEVTASSKTDVELLTDTPEDAPKDIIKPEDTPEEIQEEQEPVPNAEEVVRNMEIAPTNEPPALAEASLAAIEAALNGSGGSGDFGGSMDFSSGGRIGGKGVAGVAPEKIDEAFSLSEIDQGPRAVYQVAGNYPTEMRGKKVEGVVTVIFIVDAAGKVTNARIEKSTHPAFEKPALEAIKQWKYEAGVKGGERIACRVRQPMRFQPK